MIKLVYPVVAEAEMRKNDVMNQLFRGPCHSGAVLTVI